MVLDLYKYLVDLQGVRTCRAMRDTIHDQELPAPQQLLQGVANWQPVIGWTFPANFDDTWLVDSSWGLQCMFSIKNFLQDCTWPADTADAPRVQTMGVTWAEIAVALCYQHGTWLPVRPKNAQGEEFLVQSRDTQHARDMGITLGEQSRVVQQAFVQFQSLVPQTVMPQITNGKVKSLMTFGSAIQVAGVIPRPGFPFQKDMVNLLCKRFPLGSANLQFLPELPSCLQFEPWPEDATAFQEPWQERLRRTHQTQLVVRKLRRG
eukprot:Skav234726  [mRNA]  locus=scaffold634:538187:538975:- [translate_table: standard]